MITFKALDKAGELINSAVSPFTFPAGEKHIKREERRVINSMEIAVIQFEQDSIHDDLFQLAMWNNYIGGKKENAIRALIMPYVPGARADRGRPFGAKVYTDFILSMELDYVVVHDVHSYITGELLVDSETEIYFYNSDDVEEAHRTIFNKYSGVIAPDKGAKKRTEAFADLQGLPVYTVDKTRDFETGKLLGFDVPKLDPNGRYLIVDDICDGGGTFLGIADALQLPREQLDLYVSHGVFSKGTDELLKKFGNIYTTNSYLGDHTGVQVFDVIRPMIGMVR